MSRATRFRENMAKLPPLCFAVDKYSHLDPAKRRVIQIDAGEEGYLNVERERARGESPEEAVERLNRVLGVTSQQRAAMLCGSFHGFHVAGADPDNYHADGSPKAEIAAV